MFQASMCPSSRKNYCICATLVFVILYGWRLVADQTPPIQSDKYQCRTDTVNFSWWCARGCPKHVEKRNKYIKQDCAPSWIYLRVHNPIHKCPKPVHILSQINSVLPPHPTPRRTILILSSHLRLGLPSGLFPSGFLSKTLYTPILSPIHATCHVIHTDKATGRRSGIRITAEIENFLISKSSDLLWSSPIFLYKGCRVYNNKQPTRCNNNGLLIIPISSTCFER